MTQTAQIYCITVSGQPNRGKSTMLKAISGGSARFGNSPGITVERAPFPMAIPPCRLPTLRGVLRHTWERDRQCVKKAGTVTLAVSILLWAVMMFSELSQQAAARYESQKALAVEKVKADNPGADKEKPASLAEKARKTIDEAQNEAAFKYSAAGRVSETRTPRTDLTGFPWQANITSIGAFAATEVFVSTVATAFSLGNMDPEVADSPGERLAVDPVWALSAVRSVFAFLKPYTPCMVTVVVVALESSGKWATFSEVGGLCPAFLVAACVHEFGSALV